MKHYLNEWFRRRDVENMYLYLNVNVLQMSQQTKK